MMTCNWKLVLHPDTLYSPYVARGAEFLLP